MTDFITPVLSGSQDITEIAKALVKALPALGDLAKDKEGTIKFDKGSLSFKYADLKQLLDMAKPALAAHGLVVMQPNTPHAGGARVHTVVLHDSGQWISDSGVVIPASKTNDPKAFGSAISYARRYGLASMLSIAQADDDGHAAGQEPAPKAAKEPTVKLATKKKRDELVGRIEKLPASYSAQISANLKERGVVWTKLSDEMADEVASWIDECEALAAAENE